MEYVYRYLPMGLSTHIIPHTGQPYQAALCGQTPQFLALRGHDLWHLDPDELARRRVCSKCARLLQEQSLADLTQPAQEDGLI